MEAEDRVNARALARAARFGVGPAVFRGAAAGGAIGLSALLSANGSSA